MPEEITVRGEASSRFVKPRISRLVGKDEAALATSRGLTIGGS